MEKDNRMTVKQAADFLEVHTNTIYEWIKEGKLRADKEGKSYKINHMDVFHVYTSKTKVDDFKSVVIGIQKTKEEVNKVLHIKCYRLLRKMDKWVKQAANYSREYVEGISELNNDEYIESYNDMQNNKLEILLNARADIESFYRTVDLISSLEELYKYKEQHRTTLDEELALTTAFTSETIEGIKIIFNEVTDEDELLKKKGRIVLNAK